MNDEITSKDIEFINKIIANVKGAIRSKIEDKETIKFVRHMIEKEVDENDY